MRSSSAVGAGSRSATSWRAPSGCAWPSSRATVAPTSSMPSGRARGAAFRRLTVRPRLRAHAPAGLARAISTAHVPGPSAGLPAGRQGRRLLRRSGLLAGHAGHLRRTRRAALVDARICRPWRSLPPAATSSTARRTAASRPAPASSSWWPSWPPPGRGTALGRSTRAHRRARGGAAAGHEAVDDASWSSCSRSPSGRWPDDGPDCATSARRPSCCSDVSIPFLILGPLDYLTQLSSVTGFHEDVYGWNVWVLVQSLGGPVPDVTRGAPDHGRGDADRAARRHPLSDVEHRAGDADGRPGHDGPLPERRAGRASSTTCSSSQRSSRCRCWPSGRHAVRRSRHHRGGASDPASGRDADRADAGGTT